MKTLFRFFMAALFTSAGLAGTAQSILRKPISLNVKQQRVDHVLEIMSNRGDFYFSYNSQLFARDSLVSLKVENTPLETILDQLFGKKLSYVESGKYIILKPRPVSLQLEARSGHDEKFIHVNGWVLDDLTGERIGYASVYDRRFLSSALTDDAGFFSLRFRNRNGAAQLYISKQSYRDTSLQISLEKNHKLTIPLVPVVPAGQLITVSPMDYLNADTIIVKVEIDTASLKYLPLLNPGTVEVNPIASALLSARQKWQSLNLKNFLTTRPFQVSVLPGLSSQGKMSGQVVNNFSFNILGGYTGGVNGFELGGLFNINKGSVQYAQVGGLFNLTGNSVHGLQIGGLHNMVGDSVAGLQIGGIWNQVNGGLNGVQVGGIGNFTGKTTRGFQLGGITNVAADTVNGTQIAGIVNIARRKLAGTQVAGIVNIAGKVSGSQIGLINICDTLEGGNVGLINIVLKGYHKLALWQNEVQPYNIAVKTGTHKSYSMLMAGADLNNGERLFTFGYGLGSELRIANWLSFNPAITAEYVYQGSWNHFNLLNKLHGDVHIRFTKWLSVFGGASVSGFYSQQQNPGKDYRMLHHENFNTHYEIARNLNGWVGWNVGVHVF